MSCRERVRGGHVELDDRLGVEQEPLDRLRLGVHGAQGARPEVLGVREAQRGVVAEDDEPRDRLGVGVVLDIVEARRGRGRGPAPTRAAARPA